MSALAALAVRDFRLLWLGSAAFQLAYWVQLVAHGWLAYELTGSAAFLGLVSASTALPHLVLTLLGGVVADRWNRRSMLVWTQALMTGNALLLVVLVASGAIQPWHLALLGGISGGLTAFNLPARQSLFPQLVGPRLVANALALLALSFNVARVVGLQGSFVLIAVSMAAGTGVLLPMGPEPDRAGATRRRSLLQSVADALRYASHEPVVRWLLAFAAMQNAFGVVYLYLLPVFAGAILAVGGGGLGALTAASGIGSVAGSLAAAAISQHSARGSAVLVTSALSGAAIVIFSASGSVWVAIGSLAVMGALVNLAMLLNQTMLTVATPDELRGRVWSLHIMTWSLPPLMALPAGWVADQVGMPWTLGLLGALVLALTLLAWARSEPIRRFRDEDYVRVGVRR